MSVQWADNFGRYGTGGSSNTPMRDGLPYNNWLSSCSDDPDPFAVGERCCFINDGFDNNPLVENRIALPSPHAGMVGFAARYWFTGFGVANSRQAVAVFFKVDLTPLACCHVEPNGALTIRDGIAGTQLATTTAPVISTNSWNHIETAFNGTTGEFEVRLNGVTILTATGAVLGTIAFCNPTRRIGNAIGAAPAIKDLVIWDDTGSQNNDFMGTVVCRRFSPNADVTLGGWTLSTGSVGYSLLAKSAVNDTTYLSADDTPPAPMQFGMENLPPDVTSVRAVISVVRARKIDGGDGSLQTALISNGDFDNGADRPITTAFTYYFDVSEVSPDTAAPWTPVEFDLMTTQVDRTV